MTIDITFPGRSIIMTLIISRAEKSSIHLHFHSRQSPIITPDTMNILYNNKYVCKNLNTYSDLLMVTFSDT